MPSVIWKTNMKKKIFIILAVLLAIAFLSLLPGNFIFRSADLIPKEEPNLQLETKDSKKNGKIDSWLYRDENRVPVKLIRDSNRDGHPDARSFFREGKAFLDEDDTDHDGKVDVIYLHLRDSQGIKQRSLMFVLKEKRNNVFEVHEDTGWLPEEDLKQKK